MGIGKEGGDGGGGVYGIFNKTRLFSSCFCHTSTIIQVAELLFIHCTANYASHFVSLSVLFVLAR